MREICKKKLKASRQIICPKRTSRNTKWEQDIPRHKRNKKRTMRRSKNSEIPYMQKHAKNA